MDDTRDTVGMDEIFMNEDFQDARAHTAEDKLEEIGTLIQEDEEPVVPGDDHFENQGISETNVPVFKNIKSTNGSVNRDRRIPCMVSCCRAQVRADFGTSFHRWPKHDLEQKQLWISACGRKNVPILDNQGVCGLHFSEDSFERDLKNELMGLKVKRQLVKGAIPTKRLQCTLDEFAIRKMERVYVGCGENAVPTNKVKVEVGPLYDHALKTISDPQIISITIDRVVARPPMSKRAGIPAGIKSDYVCRIKHCPFQNEKAFMFCFPEKEQLRQSWSVLCDLKTSNREDDDNSCWIPRVCSYHFCKEDFDMTLKESGGGFRDLKPEATPSLHIKNPRHKQVQQESKNDKQMDIDQTEQREAALNRLLKTHTTTYESSFDRLLRPRRSLGVQVDFPDSCSLLSYQCIKHLKDALQAKDEEIEHLRVLVYNLTKQLSEKKSRMYLASPVIIDKEFSSKHLKDVETIFLRQKSPENPQHSNNEQLSVITVPQPAEFETVETFEEGSFIQEVVGTDIFNVIDAETITSKSPSRGRPRKSILVPDVAKDPESDPNFVRSMCCVPGCPSPVTVAYHRFPQDRTMYLKWAGNCFGDGFGNRDFTNATVCGRHFEEDCFDILVEMDEDSTATRTRMILKEDAVPTLLLNCFRNVTQ